MIISRQAPQGGDDRELAVVFPRASGGAPRRRVAMLPSPSMMARPSATASAQIESRPTVAPRCRPVQMRPSRPRMAAATVCQNGR